MLENLTFRIDGERLRFNGINWGYGDSDPYLVHHTGNYIVMRKKSGRDRSGIGQADTYPAEWFLLEVEPPVKGNDKYRVVREVRHVEPGRDWRRVKMNFILQAEELARSGGRDEL